MHSVPTQHLYFYRISLGVFLHESCMFIIEGDVSRSQMHLGKSEMHMYLGLLKHTNLLEGYRIKCFLLLPLGRQEEGKGRGRLDFTQFCTFAFKQEHVLPALHPGHNFSAPGALSVIISEASIGGRHLVSYIPKELTAYSFHFYLIPNELLHPHFQPGMPFWVPELYVQKFIGQHYQLFHRLFFSEHNLPLTELTILPSSSPRVLLSFKASTSSSILSLHKPHTGTL